MCTSELRTYETRSLEFMNIYIIYKSPNLEFTNLPNSRTYFFADFLNVKECMYNLLQNILNCLNKHMKLIFTCYNKIR